ncbi:hypothetical protein ABVV53_10240 [Novosphingobium sp. RD2P27]|uniref:Glycosyl hydrolases family 39 N-terminal catalytic domain-containing protein n=1 Tax=Novosphingobium kalidii TaxID=3230299 RepID=A0ABV2D1V9_9SPHN
MIDRSLSKLAVIAGALALGACANVPGPLVSAARAPLSPGYEPATVKVDFAQSRGEFLHPERYNNVSRPMSFNQSRDDDVALYNKMGLHGQVYRTWVDTHLIYNAKTGSYDYSGVDDYLSDLSRLSDNLLVVLDTRVEVRDQGLTPAQLKPIIKTILRDLKQRYPNIRYIEAFNEPDHNMVKAVMPGDLYSYYVPYYEAVNEVNRELAPKTPLEVGGPALTTFKEDWLTAFLDDYAADPDPAKRMDFISYHAYGLFTSGGPTEEGPRAYHFYKGDPSEVADQRKKLVAMLRQRSINTEIPSFITELGIYPGPSFDNREDPRPDYLINAAGVPSLTYWFLEQDNTVPFNWVLRHKTEERKDQLITRARDGQRIAVDADDDIKVPTGIFTPYGNAMLMYTKLKDERVVANSNALTNGKGVYAIATRDQSGAAVMLWNYQSTDAQSYQVSIEMDNLPPALRGKPLRQRMYRIDDKVSNYWANPATANLQLVSESTVRPGRMHTLNVDLTPNALQLVTLEPVQ